MNDRLLINLHAYKHTHTHTHTQKHTHTHTHRGREKSKQTDGTPLALFNMFIDRVREQLHVVLAMSPIGDAFRTRLRMFPSLVNCCTIDWFQVKRSYLNPLYGL